MTTTTTTSSRENERMGEKRGRVVRLAIRGEIRQVGGRVWRRLGTKRDCRVTARRY